MPAKKHSDFTPQPQKPRPVKDVLIDLLRDQLTEAAAREKELLRQLAAKDEQIRMVLEERFFKPVIARPEGEVTLGPAKELGELVDNTVFPTKGDEEAIAKADQAVKEAQERLLAELQELEQEQAEAHEEPEAHEEESLAHA